MANCWTILFLTCLAGVSLGALISDDDIVDALEFKDELQEKMYKVSGLKDHVAVLRDDLEELNWRFLEQEKSPRRKRQQQKQIEESVDSLNEELEGLAKESDRLLAETERFLQKMEKKLTNSASFGNEVRAMLKLVRTSP